jgi:tetratricopeptide (TPR) repeat protein
MERGLIFMRMRAPQKTGMSATLALVALLQVAGTSAAPPAAQDLAWGEALYYFYQQDYIPAITRLQVARTRQELAYHDQESELVLGGLMLGYGMHRRAETVFQALLDSHPRPSVRDQAWYFLAQARFQRGLSEEALAALARVGDDLPGRLEPERIDLEARALLAVDRPAQAAELLTDHELPGGWRFYGDYNLGISLTRAGSESEGDAILDSLGRATVTGAELASLRDRANLALGYARLSREDAAGARQAFDRVRLNGPFSNRALLGAGWADSTRGDFAAALGPWAELGGRDPLDAAVQESLIALPYAYVQLGTPGRAVDGYEQAVTGYEHELDRLQLAMETVSGGSLATSLRASEYQGNVGDAAFGRYLYALMARDVFRQSVNGLRDLDELDALLAGWQDSAEAFTAMLQARRDRFGSSRNPVMAAVDHQRLEELEGRYAGLSDQTAAARVNRDVLALADRHERQLLARIDALESVADPSGAEAARLRRLRGVIYWNANAAFPARLRTAEKSLRITEESLLAARQKMQRIETADAEAPRSFDEFEDRISSATDQIAAMRARVARATERQAGLLEQLAIGELQARHDRVSAYLTQARFALAASYDRATLAEVGQ